MSVVAAYLYQHGRRVRPVAIDERVDCPEDKSQFVWIGLVDPTLEELQTLQRTYRLHPLAVEDAAKGEQLPKLDVYGDQLFVAARTAWLESGLIRYGETSLFVGHSHIISVRRTSSRGHAALRAQLEASPTLLAPDGGSHAGRGGVRHAPAERGLRGHASVDHLKRHRRYVADRGGPCSFGLYSQSTDAPEGGSSMIEVGLFGVGLAAGAVIAWFVKPLVAGFVAGLQASATQPTIPAE